MPLSRAAYSLRCLTSGLKTVDAGSTKQLARECPSSPCPSWEHKLHFSLAPPPVL